MRGIKFNENDWFGFSWRKVGKIAELGKNPVITVDWTGTKVIYAVFRQKGAGDNPYTD